jgi:hypothetical protein
MLTKIKFLFLIFPHDIWIKVKFNFTCNTQMFIKIMFLPTISPQEPNSLKLFMF